MAKCRSVPPNITKLYLVEGAKKLLADLKTRIDKKTGKPKKPKPEELASAEMLVREAEADGLWIDVKHKLNAGEASEMRAAMMKTMIAGEEAELDSKEVSFATLEAYLLGWNLENPDGSALEFSKDALRGLDDDTCFQMRAAIDVHETNVENARKNAVTAKSEPSGTSPSAGI